MKLFNSIPYTFEEKDFHIRIYYNESSINVAAFQNGYPINGYRFQVKLPKKSDAEKVLEQHSVPYLVKMCKDAIQLKKWDSLSEVIDKTASA